VEPAFSGFPRFLRGPLGIGVAVIGLVVAADATIARYSWTYGLLKLPEVATLAIAAALLGLGIAGVVYTHRRLAQEIEAREARLAELREAALRARLMTLQAQIRPHFLFNALNSLAELVHGDADAAEQFVGDLAHLLRYSLRSSSDARVTLGQELEAVERYLRLERARLGSRLSVELQVDPQVREREIPGLVLQPLVENAVRHGIAPRPEGGSIRVSASEEGDRLVIRVEDDGPGLPPSVRQRLAEPRAVDALAPAGPTGTGGAGGGLANVRQRLALTYRDNGTLALEEGSRGTRLVLRLPRHAGGER
jgi:two-component system LytT family sensor kinase